MKEFITTWWHCLWRTFKRGHRMSYYRPAGTWKREYFCECSPRLKEVLEEILTPPK